MTITSNQTKILVAGALGAFTTTLLIFNGGVSGKFISLASIFSIGGWVVANVVIDSQADKRIREIEEKLSLEAGKVAKAKHESAENFEKWQLTKAQLEQIDTRNAQLSDELASVRDVLKLNEYERASLAVLTTKLQKSLSELEQEVQSSWSRIEQLQSENDELQAETEVWEATFQERVEQEVNERFQVARRTEIEKIFAEHDAVTGEAMQLFRRLQQWAVKISNSHEAKRSLITSLAQSYNGNLDEINAAVDRERDEYLKQIEILNVKVARLQAALNGELVEPELIDARFNPDLDLGNALCREIFYQFKMPLRFYDAHTTEDGVFHGGFMLSKGTDREALASKLHESSEALATALRLYKIESITPAHVLEGIEIRARRSRPQPVSEDAIYRIIERSETCSQALRDALDHKKGGKPTLRIMSATGGGKGIITKAFIADWIKSMPGEVWLSDPVDGSAEDHWQIPKAARSTREATKLLGEFVGEFHARKNKCSIHKDVLILGVFDEFDKQHSDEDKEKVQQIWTAIRHHYMRLILVGQSSEVGTNGWTWDAMKNCALLFVGNAITTATKQFKNIGLSQASKRDIERKYDTIKLYLEDKNKGLGSDVMYRVALLVVDDSYKFLELPPAYKGSIENGTATIVSNPWESLVSTNPSVSLASGSPLETALKARICPHCKGKLRKSGQRLRCENPTHSKDMGAKSFVMPI